MSQPYIKFNSVTQAQLGKEVLIKNGIAAIVGKNTNPNRRSGCNYALYVDERNFKKAYAVIQASGIRNMGFERGDAK